MHVVKCAICGKQFVTNRPNVKYCGLECQAKAAARRQAANHENYLEYQRKYYQAHKHADETAEKATAKSYAGNFPSVG